MSIRNLDALLTPASVVVLGASDRAHSVGGTVWRNLRHGTFKGALYPVSTRLHELFALVLDDNQRMHGLARKLGFTERATNKSAAGARELVLTLRA